jgi:lysine biosynthesis protein LysW
MTTGICPSCGVEIELGFHPKTSQRVDCHTCDAVLEIVWLEPVELDWFYDELDDEYDDEAEFEELDYYDDDYEDIDDEEEDE